MNDGGIVILRRPQVSPTIVLECRFASLDRNLQFRGKPEQLRWVEDHQLVRPQRTASEQAGADDHPAHQHQHGSKDRGG
jgi:hypothetical protein